MHSSNLSWPLLGSLAPSAFGGPVHTNYSPVIGTRYERGDSTGTLCIATQSTNQCRVGGRPGSCWTAWDRGCPSRPASPEWHKICLLILVRGAGVTGNLASLPATRIR